MDARFKPWTWTGPGTPPDKRKSRHTFKADWSQTLDLLDRELFMIGAQDIVIECGLRSQDIRVDGWPRANFPQPEHPGVRLSFTSTFGPLQYATDTFETLAANLRAIALSLEALRKVDRYGVSKSGEQYRGWHALPAGSGVPASATTSAVAPPPEPPMTPDAAAKVIADLISEPASGVTILPSAVLDTVSQGDTRFLAWARRVAHPDHGGTSESWRDYTRAVQVLTGEA